MTMMMMYSAIFGLPAINGAVESDAQQMDNTLRTSAEAMNVMGEHYKAYMSYTVNQMTPGYKEYAFANRNHNNKIEAVKFFRLAQGPPVETNNPFDCMVEGQAFFVIKGPWGEGYTRDGRFDVDRDGRLCTFSDHFLVLCENGPIQIESRDFTITGEGEIKVKGEVIDKLRVIEFSDVSNLDSFNANIFYAIDSDLKLVENPRYRIRQGVYENASVMRGLLGELPRFRHVYEASTMVIKRVLKSYQAALQIAGQ